MNNEYKLPRGDNRFQINKTDDFYRRRFTSVCIAKVQKSKWESQALTDEKLTLPLNYY